MRADHQSTSCHHWWLQSCKFKVLLKLHQCIKLATRKREYTQDLVYTQVVAANVRLLTLTLKTVWCFVFCMFIVAQHYFLVCMSSIWNENKPEPESEWSGWSQVRCLWYNILLPHPGWLLWMMRTVAFDWMRTHRILLCSSTFIVLIWSVVNKCQFASSICSHICSSHNRATTVWWMRWHALCHIPFFLCIILIDSSTIMLALLCMHTAAKKHVVSVSVQ